MTPAEQERAAVVAWLRAEADRQEALGDSYLQCPVDHPASVRHWQSMWALRRAAGLIAARAHLEEEP